MKHPHLIRRIAALALLVILTACMDSGDPVSASKITQLKGRWQQDGGRVTVRFYADKSVKLTMPDEQPPLRLVSSLEAFKNGKIGFGVGDRWNGPVDVALSKDGHALQLVFHSDAEDKKISFHRAER